MPIEIRVYEAEFREMNVPSRANDLNNALKYIKRNFQKQPDSTIKVEIYGKIAGKIVRRYLWITRAFDHDALQTWIEEALK